MDKINQFTYKVAKGETVTLVATITGHAVVKVSQPMQGSSPKWTFTVPTENPKQIYVISVEVDFIDGSVPNSKVVLTISGSEGGSFEVVTFTPESPLPECDITLRVQ
jgi:hypothetical protein